MIYQEQIMELAKDLAGFSMSEADELRKAIGKKNKEALDNLGKKFLNGIKITKKIPAKKGVLLWNDILKFGEYGFNKSHSVSYAVISYWTAWLKVYYSVEFFAANLTTEGSQGDLDKLRSILYDARNNDIYTLPVDIKNCSWDFRIESDLTIRMGLGGVKGIGEAVAEIYANSELSGGSLVEVFSKFDGTAARKNVIEALIKAGALDFLDVNRGALYASVPRVIKELTKYRNKVKQGKEAVLKPVEPLEEDNWSETEIMAREREAYGFYLTKHPLESLTFEAGLGRSIRIEEALKVDQERDYVSLVGVISAIDEKTVKNGKNKGRKYGRITLEDEHNSIIAMAFTQFFEKARDPLIQYFTDGTPVVFQGRLDPAGEKPQLILYTFRPLSEHVSLEEEIIVPVHTDGNVHTLEDVILAINDSPGNLPIKFRVTDPLGKVAFINIDQPVELTEKLKSALTKMVT